MAKRIETIRFTEDMLLNILRGKDLILVLNAEDPDKCVEFRFRGPWDGIFLTREEIQNIQYDSEMGVFGILQKLRKGKHKEFNVKSKKE